MTKLSRRTLLGAFGAGAAAVPFLPGMLRAQTGSGLRRLVVFFSPNEPIDRSYWEPSGSGADRELPSALPSLMASLEPHRDKLLFLGDMRMVTRDMDSFGGGHVGIGHMLTGRVNVPYGEGQADFWAGGMSVDQLIADRLGVDALTLAVDPRGNNGNSRISYRGRNEPVAPIDGPSDIFDSIFGDLDLSDAERTRLTDQRRSVLDLVAGNLDRTRNRLGAHQQMMLDRHLDAVRDIRDDLGRTASASCDPTVPGGGDFPTRCEQAIDLMVEALACGVSDVATLQLGNSGGAESFSGGLSWPSRGISYPVSQHVIAHDYNTDDGNALFVERREAVERVYYDLFGRLLDRMDAIPEDGGTMLDNSVVLYTKNIGQNHRGSPMFYMLAGGGGRFRTGRYLSYPDVPHNHLLVTLCQLMGLTDVESFGDESIGRGDLGL